MSDEVELLKRLYAQFNAREIDRVLATLHNDVVWANGMEGGYVHGRDGVRSYWTRQWRFCRSLHSAISYRLEPAPVSICCGRMSSIAVKAVAIETSVVTRPNEENPITNGEPK